MRALKLVAILVPLTLVCGSALAFEITVIGSSTAAGTGASSPENSWVSLMREELNRVSRTPVSVTNLAVGGAVSEELTPAGLDDRNVTRALSFRPDLILVAMTGTNDLSSGVGLNAYLAQLEEVRVASHRAGVPILFTGTSPKDFPDYRRREMLAGWNEAIRESELGCAGVVAFPGSGCLLDVFTDLADPRLRIRPELSLGDGVHLNDAGHARYASVVVPIVRDFVCRILRCHP